MQLFNNNASASLAVAISAVSTSISVASGKGALFPNPTAPDFFYCTLSEGSNVEIVQVTARATDVLTVVRGQQSTTATAFSTAAIVSHNLTAANLTNFAQLSDPWVTTALNYDAPVPAAGYLTLYSKAVVGRIMPKWVGPSGLNSPVQPALFSNCVYMWQPTTATAGLWIGTAGAGSGTYATALPTTTNIYTTIKRGTYKTVVTTQSQSVGQGSTEQIWFLGSQPYQGGFMFVARFGIENWTAGNRLFVGFSQTQTPCVSNPSVMTNMVGFGVDSGDTAITFMHNAGSGTATKDTIAGQPALAANTGYDGYFWAAPSSSTIYWRLDNTLTQTTIASGSTSTNVPVAGATMLCNVKIGNNTNTAAAAAGIGINRIYIETDK